MLRSSALPLGVVAGAAVLVLTAGPALAATTYTVKAGTQTSGTTAYTAATTGGSPQIAFNDLTSGTSLSCASGTAKGAVKLGKSLAGTGIGTITGTTWVGCKGPLNLDLNVTQVGTWKINLTGATSAAGVTPGKIAAISANVVAPAGGCSFSVTGTVNIKLTTTAAKQQLAVPTTGSTLKITNVNGCFGQVNSGDSANLAAAYAVTASAGKLAISNP